MSFRICIIGCGSHATRYHGPSYARYAHNHPGTELAACCDLDAGRAERFRSAFGFERSYTGLETMLDAERPDAVCLVAPETLTCELACRVLARNYPLIMEKPPGLSVGEVDRMLAAATATGAPTQVAFNRRYMPLGGPRHGRPICSTSATISHACTETMLTSRPQQSTA